LQAQLSRMGLALRRRLGRERERMIFLAERRVLRESAHYVQDRRLQLDRLSSHIQSQLERRIAEAKSQTTAYAGRLDALSPLRVLDRGYAIAQDGEGRAVRSVKKVNVGDTLSLRLRDGELAANITEVKKQ